MKFRPLGIFLSHSLLAFALAGVGDRAVAQSPYQTSADFTKYAEKLRESALLNMEPHVVIPTMSATQRVSGQYPWKEGIVTTVFWIGEEAAGNNPVPNFSSSWDLNWEQSYGGFDNPNPRRPQPQFRPGQFHPPPKPLLHRAALQRRDSRDNQAGSQNRHPVGSATSSSAASGRKASPSATIAGLPSAAAPPAKSATPNGAIAAPSAPITGITSSATRNPSPTSTRAPASMSRPPCAIICNSAAPMRPDWKFVEVGDVPNGPWALYGDNNDLVQNSRRGQERMASAKPVPSHATSLPPPPPQSDGPTVVFKQGQ